MLACLVLLGTLAQTPSGTSLEEGAPLVVVLTLQDSQVVRDIGLGT